MPPSQRVSERAKRTRVAPRPKCALGHVAERLHRRSHFGSRNCVLVRLDCVCHARSRRTGRSSDGAETQSVFSRQSDERRRRSDTHSVHARPRGGPCARDLRNRLSGWPMVWVDVATAANQARSQRGSEAQGASIRARRHRPRRHAPPQPFAAFVDGGWQSREDEDDLPGRG